MTPREAALQAFVDANGWGRARRAHLAGDASDRRYERLFGPQGSAVLMDNPPGGADDPASFQRMAWHLTGLGLSAPRILASDVAQGFFILEDLGDDLFARIVVTDPTIETRLYTVACDVLTEVQRHPAPPALADNSAFDWAQAAALALDWYAFAVTGRHEDTEAFVNLLGEAILRHADGPRVLILRDYHAENLLWLPGRSGVAQAGILDFQLGQMGQPGYDLVSLLQDARRDVSPVTAAVITARFATANGAAGFDAALAVLGAQRALRILGVFARLCLVMGKPGYLHLLPRVWGQLQANLAHPVMRPLARVCARLLPPPTRAVQERIARQCGMHPRA